MSDPWQRPPIATAPLSVVLIARDAAADLAEVVTAWAAQLDSLQRPYEILLVDDGSADATGARANELAQRLPALWVFRHAAARGFGAALRTGVAAATHPLLFYTTCDRQFRPEDLQLLLAAIDRVDLVTGCRAGRSAPLWWRGLSAVYRGFVRVLFGLSLAPSPCWLGARGWGRRRLARLLFGVRVHDPECAYRLFRRSVFRRIPIQSDGRFAQIEILAKANFLGCLMDEVPVAHNPASPANPAPGAPGLWAEVSRLLRDADFGPVTLPPEEIPATPTEPPPAAPAVAEPAADPGAGPETGRPPKGDCPAGA